MPIFVRGSYDVDPRPRHVDSDSDQPCEFCHEKSGFIKLMLWIFLHICTYIHTYLE